MKTPNILLFIFLFACISLKSQLSGIAFLSGQSNHAGIKIKFIAASGTAATDSAFTNAAGVYTINITNGVYSIVLSKTGYISENYNNGNTLLLTNTVTLNTSTLLPGTQMLVSGNVSGNWTNTNTYIVTGDLTVPPGSALTIQAGTVIRFNGSYSLTANGTLTAVGTAANKIVFTSNLNPPAPNDWRNIDLHNSGSVMDYCVVEYAAFGVYFSAASPTISHSIFRKIETVGIYCNNCQPNITENEVHDIVGSQGAIGIWVENNPCCGTIACNQIYGISSGYHAYGLITGSNLVKNNVIHDITTNSGLGPAIQVRGNSRIENNYLYRSVQGIDFDNTFGSFTPTICNNTIAGNQQGIHINMPAEVVNNIVTDNTYGIVSASSTGVIIDHNLVWNNSSGNYQGTLPTGVGQMISTNSQGNAIDSYYNLSQDPLYAGGAIGPMLNSNSPCFGAGDATYAPNIGFFATGTCAASLPTGLNSIAYHNSAFNIYPNPANDFFSVSQPDDIKSIHLFTVSGQEVMPEKISETKYRVGHLPNGIYFLVVETKSGSGTKKLVVTH